MAPSPDDRDSLSRLLSEAAAGDTRAAESVLTRVYQEIKSLARQRLRQERANHTLQATALVNEVYLRLVDPHGHLRYGSRPQFFHAAARAMRQILVDHARSKARVKRGAAWRRISLQELTQVADLEGAETDPLDVLSLEQAICRLEQESPELGETVRLRFFCGLTVDETAEVLAVAPSTVKRRWSLARAWLYRELRDHRPSPDEV